MTTWISLLMSHEGAVDKMNCEFLFLCLSFKHVSQLSSTFLFLITHYKHWLLPLSLLCLSSTPSKSQSILSVQTCLDVFSSLPVYVHLSLLSLIMCSCSGSWSLIPSIYWQSRFISPAHMPPTNSTCMAIILDHATYLSNKHNRI